LKENDSIYVKVISTLKGKISLSMKDVDQQTGKEIMKINKKDDKEFKFNPVKPIENKRKKLEI